MIIASGILDVGGRNCNIQLLSAGDEFLKMDSIIGLAIGLQYWYWYPLIHCLCLSYHPTTMIGVNSNLQIPSSFTLICNAKQSSFEYPKPKIIKEEVVNKKLQTTELSTTKQIKAVYILIYLLLLYRNKKVKLVKHQLLLQKVIVQPLQLHLLLLQQQQLQQLLQLLKRMKKTKKERIRKTRKKQKKKRKMMKISHQQMNLISLLLAIHVEYVIVN